MYTLESSLADLVRERLITIQEALTKANNPQSLLTKVGAVGVPPAAGVRTT